MSQDLAIIQAQQSVAGWGQLVTEGDFRVYDHTLFIIREIHQAIREGYNLLIEAPPRHGKSLVVSRFLPAWYLGRFPKRRVIHASYGISLSEDFGRAIRMDLDTWGRQVFGNIKISGESRAAQRFELHEFSGGFWGTGVGGGVTGRGADLLVTDDTLKDAEEAMSETVKARLHHWWDATLSTRLHAGGIHIGIQTPWAEDDLHGYILETRGDRYKHVRLPAFAEEDDPMGREPGQALWPRWVSPESGEWEPKYNEEWLAYEREHRPSRWWSALYQCRPTPEEGAIFKRWWWDTRYEITDDDDPIVTIGDYTTPLSSCRKILVGDMAFTKKTSSDYSVIGAFALTPEKQPRLVILDLWRERILAPDYIPKLKELQKRWKARRIYLENAGQQIGQIDYARRANLPILTIGRSKTDDLRVSGDKEAVWHEASPFFRNGRVIPPKSAPWWDAAEHELMVAPAGKNDDTVDVLSWAAHVVVMDSRAPHRPMTTEKGQREIKRARTRRKKLSEGAPNRPTW